MTYIHRITRWMEIHHHYLIRASVDGRLLWDSSSLLRTYTFAVILAQLFFSRTATVKSPLSGFCAKAAEAASGLWDVLGSSDTRDLKVKRGKEWAHWKEQEAATEVVHGDQNGVSSLQKRKRSFPCHPNHFWSNLQSKGKEKIQTNT